MLVITRKVGETLIINNNICISIFAHKGNSIRLGIDAPGHVQVFRGEVYKKIDAENKKALKSIQKKYYPPDKC